MFFFSAEKPIYFHVSFSWKTFSYFLYGVPGLAREIFNPPVGLNAHFGKGPYQVEATFLLAWLNPRAWSQVLLDCRTFWRGAEWHWFHPKPLQVCPESLPPAPEVEQRGHGHCVKLSNKKRGLGDIGSRDKLIYLYSQELFMAPFCVPPRLWEINAGSTKGKYPFSSFSLHCTFPFHHFSVASWFVWCRNTSGIIVLGQMPHLFLCGKRGILLKFI